MWVWIPKLLFLTRSHVSAALEAFSSELLDAPCSAHICGASQAPRHLGLDKFTVLGLWSPFGDCELQAGLCCAFPTLQLWPSMRI